MEEDGELVDAGNSSSHASRVAVIFNAQTRLSRAMALELALQGFSLALCAERPADLEDTVDLAFDSVELSPFKVSAYECYLSSTESIQVCAREIFEDFGRVDVVCYVEDRSFQEGVGSTTAAPVRGGSWKVDNTKLVGVVNSFYSLLIAQKPEAPPIRFFDEIPQGATRLVQEGDPEDEEAEQKSTSLFLYVSTPDSIASRAGRSVECARLRASEAFLEGLNAEAVVKGEPVRATTAVVGTLDGEYPFWRLDSDKLTGLAQDGKRLAEKDEEEPVFVKPRTSKRTSRYRALGQPDSAGSMRQETMRGKLSKQTSESLTHEEACQWMIWGLSRSRTRILVGYDVLFLESAWVPNAFLNRLFSFTDEPRNLLPLRTKDDFVSTSASAKKLQAQYNAARTRRHKARQVVLMVVMSFILFSPAIAALLLFLAAWWHRTVSRRDGHVATEHAVSAVLFVVSLRRRRPVQMVWTWIRQGERKFFGFLAQSARELQLKWEQVMNRTKVKTHRRRF